MSVVLNFKLLDPSKLSHITESLNKNFSVAKFEIGDFAICKAIILTDKSYIEIKNIFEQSIILNERIIEFINLRHYF